MLLRVTLGVVFLWMGILKLFNVSPVQNALSNAIPALGESQLLLFSAAFFEILIGAAFLSNKFVKAAAIVMAIHTFVITFAVLFTQGFAPRFPVLSLVGEHAVKNFVLIAAALTLLSEKDEKQPPTEPGVSNHQHLKLIRQNPP
jgi:uncharacterized membrane protein YphA (DoxX/SURF4 family)